MVRELSAELHAPAWLHGLNAFTTLRTQAGEPLLWQEHLRRLATTCALLGLIDPTQAAQAVLPLVPGAPEGRLRLTVTEEGLWWSWSELPPVPRGPVAVWLSGVPVHPLLAAHKTGNYLPYALAAREATQQGAFEAWLPDARGHIVDGSRTSLLLEAGGELLLPAGGLPGVTRALLLGVWDRPHHEVEVTRGLLGRASHAWITGSGVGVLPVSEVRWATGSLRLTPHWPRVAHPALRPPHGEQEG